jgi:hypothetical protein
VLQDLEKKYKDRGLTLLAASMDGSDTQQKIPRYLQEYGLGCRVLLAGENGVPGFDVQAASSLFVIDRKGFLAGVPGDFYYQMEKELERKLPDLLADRPAQGPILWAARRSPKGLSELWRGAAVSSVVSLAVAPATGDRAVEVGLLDDEQHFRRYSAKGVLLGEATLGGKDIWGLRGADLDGDGNNEWLARGDSTLSVMDSEGEAYWQYRGHVGEAGEEAFEVGGVTDLDGDGHKEIIVREADTVTALGNVPQPLWSYASPNPLRHLWVDGHGRIWAQSSKGLLSIDATGHAENPSAKSTDWLLYRGEVADAQGEPLRVFGRPYAGLIDADHDLDGDGRSDIVVASRAGVAAFAASGEMILSLYTTENQAEPVVALGDLDGRPGDEMVLFIPQYGLIALGMKGEAAASRGAP